MQYWRLLFENAVLCVLSFVQYSNCVLSLFETAILKIYLRTWIASKRPKAVLDYIDNSGLGHRSSRSID